MPKLLLPLAVVVAANTLAAQGIPSAAELATRVQSHYTSVRDFSATFTLVQTSPLSPRPRTERGEVLVKKPLMMRWTYATSDRNEFVSDGTMLYAKFPVDRYVDVSPLPTEEGTSTWLLFLAGRGDLTRDFVSSLPADQPPGEWHLTLAPPAGRAADFETMELQVTRDTYRMVGLVIEDDQGGTSHYRFDDLRENRGLSDRQFEFEIPDGFEVNWQR